MNKAPVSKLAVRRALAAVLAQHEIDDMMLEMNLTDAIWGFFERLKSGENPRLVEADIFDEFTKRHAEEKYHVELIARIETVFKFNITNEDNWAKTLKFIEKEERTHQHTIEQFAAWLEDYKFGPPTWKINLDPDLIKQMWPAAFPEGTQLEMKMPNEDGSYDF